MYLRYPRLNAAMQTAIRESYGLCMRYANAYIYGPLSHEPDLPTCPLGIDEAGRAVVKPTQ